MVDELRAEIEKLNEKLKKEREDKKVLKKENDKFKQLIEEKDSKIKELEIFSGRMSERVLTTLKLLGR